MVGWTFPCILSLLLAVGKQEGGGRAKTLASFRTQIPGQGTESDIPWSPQGPTHCMLGVGGSLVLGKRWGALVPWASCMWGQGSLPKPAVLIFPRDLATTLKCG